MATYSNYESEGSSPIGAIIGTLVLIFLIGSIFYAISKIPDNPPYMICQDGFGGGCAWANSYTEKDGCVITENGDKMCGTYRIIKNQN